MFQVVRPIQSDLIIDLKNILASISYRGRLFEFVPTRDRLDQGWDGHLDSQLRRMRFCAARRFPFARAEDLQRHGVSTFPYGHRLETDENFVYALIQGSLKGDALRLLVTEMLLAVHMLIVQPHIRRTVGGQYQRNLLSHFAVQLGISPRA